MSEVKKISRTDLYSDDELIEDQEVVLPNLEFEIIEADETNNQTQAETEEKEEFDFPLFSFGAQDNDEDDDNADNNDNETRGRSEEKTNTLRVSLRSPSPEIIIQERPKEYYFASYTPQEKSQFEQASLTGDFIIENAPNGLGYFKLGKIISLEEHNTSIEQAQRKLKKTVRPGKKARLATIKSRENNGERLKIQKGIQRVKEQKEQRKLLKKIHHKRGGKKNKKKKNDGPKAIEKPKYRTE